jgi:hypothetical protein
MAWLVWARTVDGSTEGSPSLLFSREQVGFGSAWQTMARMGLFPLGLEILGLANPKPLNYYQRVRSSCGQGTTITIGLQQIGALLR